MNRPSWHTELRARLTGLALTPVREADIVEELSSHLDERYRELCLEHEDAEAREIALSELDGSGLLAARLRRWVWLVRRAVKHRNLERCHDDFSQVWPPT